MSDNIIKGVSILTIGPAQGHDIKIDGAGLQKALVALKKRGSVKLINRHDGEFEDIVGHVENFRVEGNKLRGDIVLLDNHPMRERIIEIAEKIPTEFGLSVESFNSIENGNYRPSDIDAIALVPRPAANKGLFSSRRRTPPYSSGRDWVVDSLLRQGNRFAHTIATPASTAHVGLSPAEQFSKFSRIVSENKSRGIKFPFSAAVVKHPKLYEGYRTHIEKNPALNHL